MEWVRDAGLSPGHRQVLFWLLAGNVVATILHYVDNICFFPLYPEPTWLNAKIVDLFWFVMTPLAVLGYAMIWRGLTHRGCFVLYAYAAASLLVLGHYRFAPFRSIPLRIHLFILLEAALALALLLYVAWAQIGHFRGRPRGPRPPMATESLL